MEQLYATYKYFLSFLKKDWYLKDYPVRIKNQGKNNSKIPQWSAQVINWWTLNGLGETRQEAFEELRKSLSYFKESNGYLPRPGTNVPIEFASSHELDKYRDIVNRIISEVLGFHPDEVYLSDESSLWELCEDDTLDEYYKKLRSAFGIDVSHIESGNLVEISKFISENS